MEVEGDDDDTYLLADISKLQEFTDAETPKKVINKIGKIS